jgi:serine/threonine-protein kinase
MNAPLPVITTPLLERRERAYLAWVAVANEVAEVPLESAPIDAQTHSLEIHAKGFDRPLVLLAQPAGSPSQEGFPLRLSPVDEAQATALRAELFAAQSVSTPPQSAPTQAPPAATAEPAPTQARHSIAPSSITEQHAASLAGEPQRREPGSLEGRALADGRFRIAKPIGSGASGEVYRGVHTALRRSVAVKVLHPALAASQDYCTRFYVEALATSQLDHRNVMRVLDYGQEPDGVLYIVMELLDGISLDRLLEQEGRLSERRIVDIVAQACTGLAHAHDAGVIHRDIKPENLVVVKGRDDDGRPADLVKVCDFGIAHLAAAAKEGGPSPADEIDTSRIVGTPAYMSPEQIQNDPVDARTDVYSLGVVLYELATGELPFVTDDMMELLRWHMIAPPPPPSTLRPDLSTQLEKVILKALEKEPKDRFPDTRALRVALREITDEDWASESGMFRRVAPRPTLTASDFATKTADALGSLHDIGDTERSGSYGGLADALRNALANGQLKLATDLVGWLKLRRADPRLTDAERALAQRSMNVLRDPEVARALAAHILDRRAENDPTACAMLAEAGPLAAGALIEARNARLTSQETRDLFVETLQALGAAALGGLVSALEGLTALKSRQDESLAEDLLRGVPDERSDAGGEVAVRFVRLDKPRLAVAALKATATFWGPRARPLLVGVLDTHHSALSMLALTELERLNGIDDVVIERLGRILAHTLAGTDLKLATAAAYASAMPDARPRAIAYLTSRLMPSQSMMTSLRSSIGMREEVRVIAALAHSLHALDPQAARSVLDRLVRVRPELWPHVETLLAKR